MREKISSTLLPIAELKPNDIVIEFNNPIAKAAYRHELRKRRANG